MSVREQRVFERGWTSGFTPPPRSCRRFSCWLGSCCCAGQAWHPLPQPLQTISGCPLSLLACPLQCWPALSFCPLPSFVQPQAPSLHPFFWRKNLELMFETRMESGSTDGVGHEEEVRVQEGLHMLRSATVSRTTPPGYSLPPWCWGLHPRSCLHLYNINEGQVVFLNNFLFWVESSGVITQIPNTH